MNTNRFNELLTELRKDFKGSSISFKVEIYENETITIDMISQQGMQLCKLRFKNIMVIRKNLIDYEIVFKDCDCDPHCNSSEAIKIIVKTFETE